MQILPAASSRSASPARLRGPAFTRRWFWTVTAGEFVGFAVPACAGALTVDAPRGVAVISILAAGAVEGAALGFAQASVLTKGLAGVDRRRWVVATSAGAVVAYAIGLLPSTFAASVSGWPPVLLAPVAVILGVALLLSIGVAQWLVLRRIVPRSAGWIATTAVAWIVGLGVFLAFVTPLWQPGQPTPVVVLIGMAGGLLMAASTAAITGRAMRRIVDRSDSRPGHEQLDPIAVRRDRLSAGPGSGQ